MPITLRPRDLPDDRLGAWCNWIAWHGCDPDVVESIVLADDGKSMTVYGLHGSETIGIKHPLPYAQEQA